MVIYFYHLFFFNDYVLEESKYSVVGLKIIMENDQADVLGEREKKKKKEADIFN